MSQTRFWENLSYDLLEMALSQDGINSQLLKRMFKERPDVLESMDFGEGVTMENLDRHLYGRGS